MAFYEHFYINDKNTKVTSLSTIMNAPDNTLFIKDTGEQYFKQGNKLIKKARFDLEMIDLQQYFLSKEDDDIFDCNYEPSVDNLKNFGTPTKRLANIHSVWFRGEATSADYADVAEKYITDKKYPYGVVLQFAENSGEYELELYNGKTLAGVVSQKPGVILNDKSEGQVVALVGKTPVLCKDNIFKGQYCIAQNGGFVKGIFKEEMTFEDSLNCVGIALENSEFGYVMVKVG